MRGQPDRNPVVFARNPDRCRSAGGHNPRHRMACVATQVAICIYPRFELRSIRRNKNKALCRVALFDAKNSFNSPGIAG